MTANPSETAGAPPAGMSQFPITVLLIDDQEIIGQAVGQMLEDQPDVTLHFCQDPTKALEIADEIRPMVILQDLVMPEVDGLTLVKFFRANAATREVPMIVLSSKEEPIVKADAFALGANDYLVKLPNADFSDPGQVVRALNTGFPLEEYGDKFFTIWYGVFDVAQSVLSWCNGGHPPALLFEGEARPGSAPMELGSGAPIVGALSWSEYETNSREIKPGSRLYIYSDGVHEIQKPDGKTWTFEEYVRFLSQPADPSVSLPDRLLEYVRALKGSQLLDDDFSMVEVRF